MLFHDPTGAIRTTRPEAHNAATLFTKTAIDLDVLITLIRHIGTTRRIASNYRVGVTLLRGLQKSLMFATFSPVGLVSPLLIGALAEGRESVLRLYARAYRYPAYAANLGLSLEHGADAVWRAMEVLEAGAGEALNRHATESGVHLIPYDSPM